ncbi:RNA ligase [Paraglaciecola Antarctic GD virus 1]|nr:RNA ligase [Paraglaciecola Antarctic GD virus 1]
MEMFKYNSIEQYRHFVKSAIRAQQYTHTDEEGHAQYDKSVVLSKVDIFGTVKIHGTNAAITYDGTKRVLQFQSRNNIIDLESDNCGFVAHMDPHRSTLIHYCKAIMAKVPDCNSVRIYGEWCGGNIQAGVGVNGLPKMFVIFDVYTKHGDDWVKMDIFQPLLRLVPLPEVNIYIIYTFGLYLATVDLANPESATAELARYTNEVELDCPVAKIIKRDLGITDLPNTVGEGIVWTDATKQNCFKVKGDKHSASKVKKLVTVDPQIVECMNEFVEYACTDIRLNQGYKELFGEWKEPPEMTEIGFFIKWVMTDIAKEESDVLVNSGMTMKQVTSRLLNEIKKFYHSKLGSIGTAW